MSVTFVSVRRLGDRGREAPFVGGPMEGQSIYHDDDIGDGSVLVALDDAGVAWSYRYESGSMVLAQGARDERD